MNSSIQNNALPAQTSATEESFWSLLKKASIYIPRMQRNYVQGREDEMAHSIREKFLEDIFSSITTGEPLDVNFIYGNVENDGERFIPIDGQQRLTTLFLLHWYFAMFSGKLDEPEIQFRLKKFQYETRNVTGDFCRKLVDKVRINRLKEYLKEKNLSDTKSGDIVHKISNDIRDYYWFSTEFESDASIESMLVMLDAIHEHAKSYYHNDAASLDNVFSRLTSDSVENAPIHFLYLNLEDAGLTDTIYIKMNARGKPLTNFENFKAQLRNFLDSQDKDFANKFIGSLNSLWSEFFWMEDYRKVIPSKAHREEYNSEDTEDKVTYDSNIDDQILKFIRFGMFMDYVVSINPSSYSKEIIRPVWNLLSKESDYQFMIHLFRNGFQTVGNILSDGPLLGVETFRKIDNLVHIFNKRINKFEFADLAELNDAIGADYQGKGYLDEKDAFRRVIGVAKKNTLTYEDQVILYADYAFLLKYSSSEPDFSFTKGIELNRWLRLAANLVGAREIEPEVFFNMIKGLHYLVEQGYALNCEDYMSKLVRRDYANKDPKNSHALAPFFPIQVEEESIKAILFKKDSAWKKLILQAENTFLRGQINALLDFSGIWELYHVDMEMYEGIHPAGDRSTYDYNAPNLEDDTQILYKADCGSEYYKKFKEYLDKFKLLFDKDGVRKELEEKALFRRALLTYGGDDSYMLSSDKRQSFLDSNDRDFGFRRLFRDRNDGKRIYLKNLMDDIFIPDSSKSAEEQIEDVKQQLQNIINRWIADIQNKNSWKWYFITMPEIIGSVKANGDAGKNLQKEWVFKDKKRFINHTNDDDILLLSKTLTSSINKELYSYVFFLKANRKYQSSNENEIFVGYRSDYGYASDKYAYYADKDGNNVKILYQKPQENNPENKYYFIIRKDNGQEDRYQTRDVDEFLEYLDSTNPPAKPISLR